MNNNIGYVIFTQIIFNIIFLYFFYKYFSNYFLDHPDSSRKLHKIPAPYTGGFLIIANIIFLLFLFLYFNIPFLSDNNLLLKHVDSKRFIFCLFILPILFFFIGLLDDIFSISSQIRLLAIIIFISISLLVYEDLIIKEIYWQNPQLIITLYKLSTLFTLFCILTMINFCNFYDGINGQSGIYFLIILAYLMYKDVGYFPLYLLVPIFFFLILNLNNRGFMGDSGIYTISFVVSILIILSYNNKKIITEEIILLLFIPLLDMTRLTFSRIKRQVSPLKGDRYHIHHLLNSKLNILQTNIVLILIIIIPLIFFLLVSNFYIPIFLSLLMYIYIIIKYKN